MGASTDDATTCIEFDFAVAGSLAFAFTLVEQHTCGIRCVSNNMPVTKVAETVASPGRRRSVASQLPELRSMLALGVTAVNVECIGSSANPVSPTTQVASM